MIAALYLAPEDCRCDYDEESEALYQTTLAWARQVADTDAAYREWARGFEPVPLREAA